MLVEGEIVLQDIKKGVDILTAATEINHNARYYLAKLYLNGEGVERNIEKAVAMLETCKDNPYSMYALSKLYLSGELPQNVELFFKWGICFEQSYAIEEKAARQVQYANMTEIEGAIFAKYPPAVFAPVEYRETWGCY